MEFRVNEETVDSWKEVQLVYNSALKEIGTKLEILNDEFQHVHRYNPIEHIKARLKTPESIVKKLKKNGEVTEDDQKKAEKDLQDLLDQYIKKVDVELAAKEKELMAI